MPVLGELEETEASDVDVGVRSLTNSDIASILLGLIKDKSTPSSDVIKTIRNYEQQHISVRDAVQLQVGLETCVSVICANGNLPLLRCLVEEVCINLDCRAKVLDCSNNFFIEQAFALWICSDHGHVELVEYLLQQGADINAVTELKSTALRVACFDGHLDVVKALVCRGADMSICNKWGTSCIMLSAYNKFPDIVEYLCQQEVDLTPVDDLGLTALHYGSQKDVLRTVKTLVRYGAPCNVKDKAEYTPLMRAAYEDQREIFEFFISKEQISRLEKLAACEMYGALCACKFNAMEDAAGFWQRSLVLRKDLGEDAPPKPLGPSNWWFEGDIEFRNLQQVSDALEAGVDAMQRQAMLVLFRLFGPTDAEFLHYFNQQGSLRADQQEFQACFDYWLKRLQWLCVAKNMALNLPRIVLHFSEIFKLVRNIEASLHLILLAHAHLQRIGGGTWQQLMQRTHLLLHESKANFSETGSLLHWACNQQTWRYVDYTDMSYSFSWPSPELISILLELGADADAQDAQGNTPLHYVCMATSLQPRCVQLLAAASAHCDVCNIDNKTCVECSTNPHTAQQALGVYRLQSLRCIAAKQLLHLPTRRWQHLLDKHLLDFVHTHHRPESDSHD